MDFGARVKRAAARTGRRFSKFCRESERWNRWSFIDDREQQGSTSSRSTAERGGTFPLFSPSSLCLHHLPLTQRVGWGEAAKGEGKKSMEETPPGGGVARNWALMGVTHTHVRTPAEELQEQKKKHSVSERREGAELDGTLEPGPGVLRATIGGGLEPMMPRGRPLVHSSYSAHP